MVGKKLKPVYVIPVGICWLVVVKKKKPTAVVPVGIRRLVVVKKKKPTAEGVRVHIGAHWAEGVGRAPPGGVWVGVWFSSRLYYPFGKGPGQHKFGATNKKCEN